MKSRLLADGGVDSLIAILTSNGLLGAIVLSDAYQVASSVPTLFARHEDLRGTHRVANEDHLVEATTE